MKENKLVDYSMNFSIKVVNICKEIKTTKKESILTNQLLRSGTSIGANIRESNYANSKNDFIAKLHIALKECFESIYWVELLFKTNYLNIDDRNELQNFLGTLRKLLISSLNTAKNKNK